MCNENEMKIYSVGESSQNMNSLSEILVLTALSKTKPVRRVEIENDWTYDSGAVE